MLQPDEIISAAELQAGLSDGDPAVIRENLDNLTHSLCRDRPLSKQAADRASQSLIARTADRLRAQKWHKDFPEIAEEKIDRPVFLCGLPRSGTTYLQYLFDCDSRFRLVRSWEATTPFPPPGYDPVSAQRRMEEERAMREQLQHTVKDFDAMHLVDADGPQECHVFMEQGYAAVGYHNLYDVPAYFDYLRSRLDFVEAYRVHRRQMQCLQWNSPHSRWALKYPGHLLALDSILQVYPDARFIMTHRDPVQTLASLCKLTTALRGTQYDEAVDPVHVGKQMLEFVQWHIDRIMHFSDSALWNRVHHIDYYQLLWQPAQSLESAYASLDMDFPQVERRSVERWYADNPRGARGENRYALQQYGLAEEAVAEQFSAYMQRFAIPREAEGVIRYQATPG